MQTRELFLKKLNLQVSSVLNKEELKKIIGGTSNVQCDVNLGGTDCAAGECCSPYGYCGSGPEYCGCLGGTGCPPNTVVCWCYDSSQFSCVYGGDVAEASINFSSVCGNFKCSLNWGCN